MRVPPVALVVIAILFGFLSASTIHFYQRSRVVENKKRVVDSSFNAEIPEAPTSAVNEKIDQLTVPAEPKGRLSYPANTYTVLSKETLFTIGDKLGLSWSLLKKANSITNENLIQAGYVLAVPKLDVLSDYYRINFLIDENKATELNRELKEANSSQLFSPIEVAKKNSQSYFGITDEYQFRLIEEDLSKGTAVVEASGQSSKNLIGLIQPRLKGKNGFWAILYIENRE